MKISFSVIFLLLGLICFSQQPGLSANFTPNSQTITGELGTNITATVTVSWPYSTGSGSYFLSPCNDDGGFMEMDWPNATIDMDNPKIVKFRFRKPTTASTGSFTYTFKRDLGTNCDESPISITVNYTTPTCNLPAPTGLSGGASSPTSMSCSWIKNSSAVSYELEYKKNSALNWSTYTISVAECGSNCSPQVFGLTPNTQYGWRVRAVCSNGIKGAYSSVISFSTPVCSATGPTNLNATPWNNNGVYSYYISFTPVTGTTIYNLEYTDLTTNISGSSTIYYSSVPNEGNNLDGIPTNHSIKFRLQVPCSGVFSEWKTIPISSCLADEPVSKSLIPYCMGNGTIGGQCGYGLFTWSSVTGVNLYEVEYIIYNTSSGQSLTGSFTSSSTSIVRSGMYTPSGTSANWRAKFRIRSRCTSGGIWGEFGPYTIDVPW